MGLKESICIEDINNNYKKINEKIDNKFQGTEEFDINWFEPWLKLGFVLEIKVLGSLK